jgi:N-acetylglucosaminyldiphosphoundecaprenol N-acetyl-beta-D-mannosaminyltransferase
VTPFVFGVRFTSSSIDDIADQVTAPDSSDEPAMRILVTMNLDHVIAIRKDQAFRAAYLDAWCVTADGMPVYLYARARGAKLPGRITGSDLFPKIMERLRSAVHRPFFLVSSEATKASIELYLRRRGFSECDFAVVVPAFGFEGDRELSQRLVRSVQSLRATHVFAGVGSPKSEVWLHRHRADLGVGYGFSFGAGVDFFAGTKKRAPRIMQRIGLEWVYRFLSEPRRLFHRYFVRSWVFLAAVRDDVRNPGPLQP